METPGRPSLDDFLAQSRGNIGPCIYVRNTTPEQRATIREKIDQGLHRWTAYARWLESQGTTVLASQIQFHVTRHDDDER